MASGDVNELIKCEIIRNNKDEVERIMSGHEEIDFITINGPEGNIMNSAVEMADVEVLALLLGVQHPIDECATAISFDQYVRINSVCDDEGMTLLMKAVKLQKLEMVTLLLALGAEVNDCTRHGEAAIDLSNDPNILSLLFQHDSKFPVDEVKSKELKDLILKDKEKLSVLFEARDKDHEFFKGRESSTSDSISPEIKKAIMRRKYYVNSEGQSLLYTTLNSENFRTWAELLNLGMEYATMEEKEHEKNYEDNCERALVNVLVPLDDCHIMKLATKSYNLQRISHWRERNDIVLEYFKHMNYSTITKTLMEVVQDVPGFHIAFDFESSSIERIRSCRSRYDRGITDINRFKICVAAEKNDQCGFPEIVSNIVHELCHLALVVVFKNQGLPYLTHDDVRKKLYREVMDKVRYSKDCDDIISKVWTYPEGQQGMELIVRVPEMISKYQGSKPDGHSRLNEQAEALLDFYEKHVQPDLTRYTKSFFTSQRIMGRGLIEYQELFFEADGIRVTDSIGKDIRDFIGEHNNLKVLKASNLKIALNHLKLSLKKEGKPAPFCVNWSFYLKNELFIRKGLVSCEIETLAIFWDVETLPKFCADSQCGNCLGYHFRDFRDCVYLMVSSTCRVLNGIKSLEYSWDDLAPETKKIILERQVEFGGKHVKLETLISGPEDGDCVDEFCRDRLDSEDISFLLSGGDIVIGKSISRCDGRENNVILKHPAWLIPRELRRNYVKFNDEMLGILENDVFCVGSIEFSRLRDLGISEGYIREWDGNTLGGSAHCYIVHSMPDGKNEELVIREIFEHLRSRKHGNMLHYLKYRRGMFAHIRSVDIRKEDDIVVNNVEGLTSSDTVQRLPETVFKTTDPLLIADDPGTGKSTYLQTVAEEIKKTHLEKWVSIIDLGSPTQQKHLLTVKNKLSFSQEEALDLLFQLVGSGQKDSLERKIFDEYCEKKNKILIFFDSFDEICPKYKSLVTSFIVALSKVKDAIKMLVSTQLSQKFDLEEAMDVISYQLDPWSEEEDQLTKYGQLLNSYWNELLQDLSLSDWQGKIISSIGNFETWVEEINDDNIRKVISVMKRKLSYSKKVQKRYEKKINFKPIARGVLLCWKTLFNGPERSVLTPLYVIMLSALTFEDSFDIKQIMNLGQLYQRFFNMTMKRYLRERVRCSDNAQAEDILWMAQEKMTKTLEKISVNLFQVGFSYKVKEREIKIACSVGLLSQKEEGLQFIHRTFAEFFFARRMIREAGRSDVAKLWIESIFVDDSYANVRTFLENLMYLLSEVRNDSRREEDFLMLEKANLDQSVLCDPSGLANSIYCIVHECNVYTLEYFAESFGEKLAEMLIQKFDSNSCSAALRKIVSRRTYGSSSLWYSRNDINAITFAGFCYLEGRISSQHVTIVKKMLDLVKKHDMLNKMEQHLRTNGVGGLFLRPSSPSMNTDGHFKYTEELLRFLLENKDTFGNILRGWMTPPTRCYAVEIFRRIYALHPDLLHLVVKALYDQTQLKSMLMKEGVVSLMWIHTTGKKGLKETEQFWSFIKEGLEMDKTHLRNYLEWKDDFGYNALRLSAHNEDTEVIEFIWGLAGELMDDDEKKKWLFDSFDCRFIMDRDATFSHWSFHKFLVRRAKCGFLSGNEILLLLKSKNERGICYILHEYPYGLFTHLSPIDNYSKNRDLLDEMRKANPFCLIDIWLEQNSSSPLNRDRFPLDKVDEIFMEVRVCDSYELAAEIEWDDSGYLVGEESRGRKIHPDRFKYTVVAFYKHVHFCKNLLKRDEFIEYMRSIFYGNETSIFHQLFNLKSPLFLGYISSILIESLSRGQFLAHLLESNYNGDNVFARGDCDSPMREKLNEIVGKIFGKYSVPLLKVFSEYLQCRVSEELPLGKIKQLMNVLCQKTDGEEDEKLLLIMRLLCQENKKTDDDDKDWPLARIINSFWIETVWIYENIRIRQIWDIIKGSLRDDRNELRNYLQWKDSGQFNALVRSAYNEDPKVIEFIWELAVELMEDEERKMWLFNSFDCGVSGASEEMYLGWSFHKFLAGKVNCGYLSGDEMICLVKSKNTRGNCYILRGSPYGFFTHIEPIDQHITLRPFVEEMRHAFNFFYFLDNHMKLWKYSLQINNDLINKVDEIFIEVRSHDKYKLIDNIEVDEYGLLLGDGSIGGRIHLDRFKFFVVTFLKQVHFCKQYLKKDGLVKCLKMPEKFQNLECNILHKIESPLSLRYVSKILIDVLPLDDFLDLLFEGNENGVTLFHRVSNLYGYETGDSNAALWNELNVVIGALLGKYARSADPNEQLLKRNMPVSRKALEEILVEWKGVWASQKEETPSEVTLSEATD